MSTPWQDVSSGKAHPSPGDQAAALARLVELLQQVLVPVQPDPAFRARLHRDLVTAGREQAAARRTRRRWTSPWALAAAGIASAVSVAIGIVTYILWHRTHTAPS